MYSSFEEYAYTYERQMASQFVPYEQQAYLNYMVQTINHQGSPMFHYNHF